MQLTQEQQIAFMGVEWLIQDTRRNGKSTVLALAFIKKAICNPNQWIKVWDHSRLIYRKENMISLIKNILIKENIEEHFCIDLKGKRISKEELIHKLFS